MPAYNWPTNVATQGVNLYTLISAMYSYLKVITQFNNDRRVIEWHYSERPNMAGYNQIVWFRPVSSPIDESTGPVRFGNKVDVTMEVNFSTRYNRDMSERDRYRAALHYQLYWKFIESFQGRHLFDSYDTPRTIDDKWYPPEPSSSTTPPLTVEPMLIKPLPENTKDEKEEATMSTRLSVTLPAVLALTIIEPPAEEA